jgi:hypothetical protein
MNLYLLLAMHSCLTAKAALDSGPIGRMFAAPAGTRLVLRTRHPLGIAVHMEQGSAELAKCVGYSKWIVMHQGD